MRLLILTMLALPAASTAAAPGPKAPQRAESDAAKAICARNGVEWAAKDAVPALKPELKQLGELPAGAMILSVLREENGCTKPVVVRYGYGGGGPAARAAQDLRKD